MIVSGALRCLRVCIALAPPETFLTLSLCLPPSVSLSLRLSCGLSRSLPLSLHLVTRLAPPARVFPLLVGVEHLPPTLKLAVPLKLDGKIVALVLYFALTLSDARVAVLLAAAEVYCTPGEAAGVSLREIRGVVFV